jgi:hypothetical protein
VLVLGRPPIGERAMTSAERQRRHRERVQAGVVRDRRRCDASVAIRVPVAVRKALERAAARDLCSISDVIRRAMLDRLRSGGLIEEAAP